MRENYWYIIAITPLTLILVGIIEEPGTVLAFPAIIAYPFAIRLDAKYVQSKSNSSVNVFRATILGVLVTLSLGIFSYIITPYYLYKRRGQLKRTEQ